MFCVKCGEKFADNLKYCPHCGTSIDTPAPEPETKGNVLGPFPGVVTPMSWLLGFRVKYNYVWLLIYHIPFFFICAFPVAIIFALFATSFLSAVAGAFGLAGSIIMHLMQKGKIKTKKWISVCLVLFITACISNYISLFSIDFSALRPYNWDNIKLSENLPQPSNVFGTIELNEDEKFELILTYATQEEFDQYVKKCKEAGYLLDKDENSKSFYARNGKYKIFVDFYDETDKMKIRFLAYDKEEELKRIEKEKEKIKKELEEIIRTKGLEGVPTIYQNELREYFPEYFS